MDEHLLFMSKSSKYIFYTETLRMNNHNEIKCERMDAYVLFQLFQ